MRRIASLITATALAMPILLSSGASASAIAPSAAAPNAATPSKGGPLTPRLQLVADPAFEALTPEAQAQKLFLAASGAGSLMQRPGGRILVDIRVSDTSAATLGRLEAAGAHITFVADSLRTVTAEVAPSDLTSLAAVQPEVRSVLEILEPMVNAACPTGDFVSEGDTQLNAAFGRTNHGVNGAGIMVGVISDTYNKLAGAPTDVTNGELPGTTNPCSFPTPVIAIEPAATGTDEGRAMTQIVHDLAPGASLRFSTAFNGEADFAQQIRDLATAGAKVIVDDVSYFDEPMYQDGVVAKAVEDVSAAGVAYFSSAANSNAIVGGNDVSSYEAPAYRPMACPASVVTFEGSPAGLTCHDFNPGAPTDNTYRVTTATFIAYTLGWSEPQFGITDDLDLCLLNTATGAVIICSFEGNIASDRAYERFSGGFAGSGDLVVARFAGTGTPRFKLISTGSNLTAAEYATGSMGDVVGPTIFGHNASRAGASVAAIPFDNSATIETYSSRGPATWCWGPVVGTVPATVLTPCQTATVDMSATDGGQNSFFGGGSPHRFYGTSAAAPHAAAIAALMRQRAPCLTPAQIIAAMKATALPVGAFGVDTMGAGRLDANAAIGAASCGPSYFSLSPSRILDTRIGTGLSGTFTSGTARTFQVTGVGGVPAGAVAVTGNLTVTQQSSPGFVALTPAPNNNPTTSTLNFPLGDNRANGVTVALSGGGQLSATYVGEVGGATTHLIFDVTGYFVPNNTGATYVSLTPARLLDTRIGTGLSGTFTSGTARTFQVTGVGGVPAGAIAVTGNLTVTQQSSPGFVSLTPAPNNNPTTSTLNFPLGDNRANGVTVALSGGGQLSATYIGEVGGATTHLIFDVTGYFLASTTGGTYVSLTPARILDSRIGVGLSGTFSSGTARTFQVTGQGGVPANAVAVTGNLTVTQQTSPGFASLTPAPNNNPTTSTLNFPLGDNRANGVGVALSLTGTLSATYVGEAGPSATTHLIFDVTGYFLP